jgi:hypothetical protein
MSLDRIEADPSLLPERPLHDPIDEEDGSTTDGMIAP